MLVDKYMQLLLEVIGITIVRKHGQVPQLPKKCGNESDLENEETRVLCRLIIEPRNTSHDKLCLDF